LLSFVTYILDNWYPCHPAKKFTNKPLDTMSFTPLSSPKHEVRATKSTASKLKDIVISIFVSA